MPLPWDAALLSSCWNNSAVIVTVVVSEVEGPTVVRVWEVPCVDEAMFGCDDRVEPSTAGPIVHWGEVFGATSLDVGGAEVTMEG